MANGATPYDILQNRIDNEARAAEHYIQDRIEPFKSNVSQTIAAIQLASREYDSILKAQAAKSLFGEIFINLVVTLIPAANLVKHGGSFFTLGSKMTKTVEILNDKYVDLIKNFKEPFDKTNEDQENQTKEQEKLAASNDAIRKEMTDLFALTNKIDELARNSRTYIRMKVSEFQNGKDNNIIILAKIRQDFKDAGLDSIKKVGAHEFNLLTEQMLYDILRKYVSTYVVFKIGDNLTVSAFPTPSSMQSNADLAAVRSKKASDLPQYRNESLVSGLDQAQRDAIYKRFGKSKNQVLSGDVSRPTIDDYKDLIRYWGAKTVSASSGKEIRWIDINYGSLQLAKGN
jgi:hypothetical protein